MLFRSKFRVAILTVVLPGFFLVLTFATGLLTFLLEPAETRAQTISSQQQVSIYAENPYQSGVRFTNRVPYYGQGIVYVSVVDGNNAPVSGATVTLASSFDTNSVSIPNPSTITDTLGNASFFINPKIVGKDTLSISVNGIQLTSVPQVEYFYLISNTKSSVSVDKTQLYVGQSAILTVIAKDFYQGKSYTGEGIRVASNIGALQVDPLSAVSGADGSVSFTVKAISEGTGSVTASFENMSVPTQNTQNKILGSASITVTKQPSICSSWTYSNWGACNGGKQTRSILTYSPVGCSGGSPVLEQGCTLPAAATPSATLSNYQLTSTYPGSVPADNSSSFGLKVTAIDTNGQPMPQQTITLSGQWSGQDDGLSVSPGSVVYTDQNGVAEFTFKAKSAGSISYEIILGSKIVLPNKVDLTFTPWSASGTAGTLAQVPASATDQKETNNEEAQEYTANQNTNQNQQTPTPPTTLPPTTATPSSQAPSISAVSSKYSSITASPILANMGDKVTFALLLKDENNSAIASRSFSLIVTSGGQSQVYNLTTDSTGAASLSVIAEYTGGMSASAMIDKALFIASATIEKKALNSTPTSSPAPDVENPLAVPEATLPVQAPPPTEEKKTEPVLKSAPGTFVWNKQSGILTYKNQKTQKIITIWDARWGFNALRGMATVVPQTTLNKISLSSEKSANVSIGKKYAGQMLVDGKNSKLVWYVHPKTMKRYWFDGSQNSYAFLISIAEQAK